MLFTEEDFMMTYKDFKQYKVIRGNARESGISATYEYTSGNKTSKTNGITARRSTKNEG